MALVQTWFSFECICGCVADVRLDDEPEFPPVVHCPVCYPSRIMRFGARWLADEHGYGSRGDAGADLAIAALTKGADSSNKRP